MGAAVEWIVLRELRGTSAPAPAPTHPCLLEEPGFVSVVLLTLANGEFHIFSPRNCKQLKVVPLVSIFNSAGAQLKLTFFFLYISS